MNTIILCGRIGQTPQLRYTNHERIPVTTLRIATKDRKRNTVWHNVTVWSQQAEQCCKFLEKGSCVSVSARLEYKDIILENSQSIAVPEIVANHVQFI